MKTKASLAALAACGLLGQSAWGGQKTWIESIEGNASQIALDQAKPQKRIKALVGQKLNEGDKLSTGNASSARVLQEDGTQVVIGRSSSYTVRGPLQGAPSGELHFGEVRAKVEKLTQSAPGKLRFALKTRSMVLGVRGTEFVASSDAQGKSEVRTLEGKLEAAKDVSTLTSGKGVPVAADQVLSALPGGKLGVPQAFDRQKFLADLQARQPDASAVLQKAPKFPEAQRLAPPSTVPVPKPPTQSVIPPGTLPPPPMPGQGPPGAQGAGNQPVAPPPGMPNELRNPGAPPQPAGPPPGMPPKPPGPPMPPGPPNTGFH